MKRVLAAIVMVMFGTCMAWASESGTPAEVEAMVTKAIELIKASGKEKAFAEFTNPKGRFIDRDLYVTVYDLNGKCLTHGVNPKMIGKDLIDLKDIDGKPYIRERMELAKTKGKFWQDFKFTNPVSKKIEPKSMYCEKYEDMVMGCGVYKK